MRHLFGFSTVKSYAFGFIDSAVPYVAVSYGLQGILDTADVLSALFTFVSTYVAVRHVAVNEMAHPLWL